MCSLAVDRALDAYNEVRRSGTPLQIEMNLERVISLTRSELKPWEKKK